MSISYKALLGSCLTFLIATTSYVTGEVAAPAKTEKKAYTKDASATQKFEGKQAPFAIYVDPTKWDMVHEIPDLGYLFKMKDKDVHGVVTAQTKMLIPMDKYGEFLKNIAEKQGLSNIRIVENEARTINGKDVFFVNLEGDIPSEEGEDGAPKTDAKTDKIVMLAQVFTNDKLTAEAVVTSSKEVYDANKAEMEKFVKGFDYQDNK